jgi:hypothetical protein
VPCSGLVAAIKKEKGWEDETGHFQWVAEDGVYSWGDPKVFLTWKASPVIHHRNPLHA